MCKATDSQQFPAQNLQAQDDGESEDANLHIMPLLHSLAFIGDVEGLKLCVEEDRCDVNKLAKYRAGDGRVLRNVTALFLAAMSGHLGAVQYLLAAGADPTIKATLENAELCTPAQVAALNLHLRVALCLRRAANAWTQNTACLSPPRSPTQHLVAGCSRSSAASSMDYGGSALLGSSRKGKSEPKTPTRHTTLGCLPVMGCTPLRVTGLSMQGGSPMDDLDLSKLSFRDADESVYVKVDAVENKEPCASRSRVANADEIAALDNDDARSDCSSGFNISPGLARFLSDAATATEAYQNASSPQKPKKRPPSVDPWASPPRPPRQLRTPAAPSKAALAAARTPMRRQRDAGPPHPAEVAAAALCALTPRLATPRSPAPTVPRHEACDAASISAWSVGSGLSDRTEAYPPGPTKTTPAAAIPAATTKPADVLIVPPSPAGSSQSLCFSVHNDMSDGPSTPRAIDTSCDVTPESSPYKPRSALAKYVPRERAVGMRHA